jgi:hypothetical protein
VPHQRGAALAQPHEHLLAGRQRLRLLGGVRAGDHSRLAREHVGRGRLELPERPQAERVDREHALVGVASDQGNRPLSHRPERLPQVHVEPAQVLGHPLDLVDDRRQQELERLDQAQPGAVDQRLDDAAQVL